MLVSVRHVYKSFLDVPILRDVSLEVAQDDRIGLLGVNGAGKTTLLNIIFGALTADEGTVVRASKLSIGYLKQNDALTGEHTLAEEAEDAFHEVRAVRQAMDACCEKLAASPNDAAVLAEYDRLCARFEAMDGYHLDEKTDRVLTGLGFGGFARSTKVNTLSGGEKMRFAIAKMLLRAPDLLILDEPTNHLDFSMLAWLEGYLAQYKGAVLVVSHDRYFLDTIAKDICEIERGALTRYKGGYSGFVLQKAERRKTALRAWEKQQEEIAKMEEYVRKNLARSASASGVGTRVKALEKMVRLEKPPPEGKTIALRFEYDTEPFKDVLICRGLGVRVGEDGAERELYAGLDLAVVRGEKIALVGLNGVGKSTFLKAIQGLVPHEGQAKWGSGVRPGYFDQELAGLPMEATVLEAVHSRYPTKTEFEIRSALGCLLIEGEAVYKKVRELSGANRAKVAFAILQMQRANVLLLDEPTNHLDYRAKEVLEAALRAYSGTLVVVSHDRYFLRRVPQAILEMRPDGFRRYEGNYDVYLAQKAQEQEGQAAQQSTAEKQKTPAQDSGYRTKQQRALDSQRRTRLSTLEAQIEKLEQAIEEANTALAAPQNASDYAQLQNLSEGLSQNTAALDAAMREWLELTTENETK